MSKSFLYIGFCIILIACIQKKKETIEEAVAVEPVVDTTAFFPVTPFLKGQLQEAKNLPINPLVVINEKDSSYIRTDELENILNPFFLTDIDSINLKEKYNQQKFFDHTVGAVTFTYDLKPGMQSINGLKKWDVYVSPSSGKVLRVFLLRNVGDTVQQLTWKANESAQLTIIHSNKVVSNKKIIWDY